MGNYEVQIQDFTLNDYKLDSNRIKTLSLFNSLEQYGMTLEIVYDDVSDVKGKMPLKGGEELSLVIVDQYENKLKKTFILRVVKVLSAANTESSIIQLKFISKEGFYLGINRDYTSYTNVTASNIIKGYIPTVVDKKPTTDLLNICIPGYTKTKAINYVCSFTNNYNCFETNDKFIFSGIEDLLVPSDIHFKVRSNNPKDKFLIVDMKEKQSFNAANETYDNIYSNVYKSFNPATKTVSTVKTTIQEEQAKIKTLGTGENFSTKISSEISPRITMIPYAPNILNYSNSLEMMFNKCFEILINGNLELEVGDTINLNLLEMYNNNPNELLSGLYLVTKTAHHISSTEFWTKVEVQKNAYNKGNVTSNAVL